MTLGTDRRTPPALGATFAALLALVLAASALLASPSSAAENGTISGKVTGEDGAGIAGIIVTAQAWFGDLGTGDAEHATTTSTGEYEIDLPPGTYLVHFQPAHDSNLIAEYYDNELFFGMADPLVLSAGLTTTADAMLTLGSSISGVVTAGGAPLGGVEVSALIPGPDGSDRTIASTVSESDGSYILRGVPSQSIRLTAFSWESGPGIPTEFELELTDRVDLTDYNLALDLGGTITGTITDSHGDPIPEATVSARGLAASQYGVTDAEGKYSIAGLPTGTYDLYVLPPWDSTADRFANYVKKTPSAPGDAATAPLAVVEGETVVYDDSLQPGAQITGTITYPDGSPIADATAIVLIPDGQGDWTDQYPQYDDPDYADWNDADVIGPLAVLTDTNGTYVIDGLPAGQYKVRFNAYAWTQDYSEQVAHEWEYFDTAATPLAAQTISLTTGGLRTGVNAMLSVGGTVTGTLTTTGNAPLDSAHVHLHDAATGEAVGEVGYTWLDGVYTIAGVRPGTYTLRVVHPEVGTYYFGDTTARADAQTFTVASGQVRSGIDVRLGAAEPVTPTPPITPPVTPPGTKPTTPTKPALTHPAKQTVSRAPYITGTPLVGKKLKVAQAILQPGGTAAKYQWHRNGKAIKGATKSTYKLVKADRNKKITVKVTYRATGYHDITLVSPAVRTGKITVVTKPWITGTAKVGNKLTAKAGTVTPKAKASYQWYRNGKAIKGASKKTYRLVKADRKKKITVKVTYRATGFTSTASKSPATAKVK